MFGKYKKTALFNSVDDTRNIVHDFRLRFPFESYRPTEYLLYSKLDEKIILPKIDEHLEKLFAGDIDDGNGNTLDAIIFSSAREAKPDLTRQRHNHTDTINRLITRRKTDIEDFKNMLKSLCSELEELKNDYYKICKQIDMNLKEESI